MVQSRALDYCARAEELARSIGYPIAIAQITDTRAMVELKLGRFSEAAATAEAANAIATTTHVIWRGLTGTTTR